MPIYTGENEVYNFLIYFLKNLSIVKKLWKNDLKERTCHE